MSNIPTKVVSCKDCIHYEVCQYHITEETDFTVEECSNFFEAIVCCKDCKFAKYHEVKCGKATAISYKCTVHDSIFDADDFCNYGVRKDSEDDE